MHHLRRQFLKATTSVPVALAFGVPLSACNNTSAQASAASSSSGSASGKEVTIAYQQIAGPLVTLIANGTIEKVTGYKINWRQFESGAKVATAMTSGDVHIGVIGSSPLTAAASQGVDLQLFWILDDINDAEALIVRNAAKIQKPADLRGKKLAVPFVSTSHFHAMFALEQWGLKPSEVQVMNMQPNQIVAAWDRGDIDAAYTWDPALAKLKQSGKVMITSGELSRKGKATFDGIAVQRSWGDAHADFMARFVKAISDADNSLRSTPGEWDANSANARTIAGKIGGTPAEAADAIRLYAYPSIQQQASSTWLGGDADGGASKALKATAEFLKEQKKINQMAPDYSRFVTPRYALAAMQLG